MMKTILSLIISVVLITVKCKASIDSLLNNYEIIHSVNIHSRTKRSTGSVRNREMDVSMFGRNFTLELQPSRDLFSKRFKIILVNGDNSERIVSGFDQSHFYTGHVIGETNSRVAIHLDSKNVATGVFTAGGEEYYMEPLHRHHERKEGDFHDTSTMVGYRKSDIKTEGTQSEHCGAVHPNFTDHFHEIKFDTFNKDSQSAGRYKRAVDSTKKACPVLAIADYKFFQAIGGSDNFTTANYIAGVFSRVNSIYKTTNFGFGTGYGLEIDTMIIHTASSTNGDVYPYNILKDDWGTLELLQSLGSADQFSDYCLAHLFTYQSFGGTLGLSYIASPQVGTLGGICSPTRTVSGQREIFNIAWTSLRNSGGNTLLFTQAALVTAHGHNFGSEHDPSSGDCAPYSLFGGKYLMFTYSVTGEDENNDMFSSCSRSSIGAVLNNKASICFKEPAEETLCGNGRVDAGEECDGGFLGRIGQNNKCCTQDCQFTNGANCSPDNSPCCTAECQVASPGFLCSGSIEGSCLGDSSCNGNDVTCPQGNPKIDGTDCVDGGSCLGGVCLSFCEYRNLNSCVCDAVETSCQRCCRDQVTGECTVNIPVTYHLDGRPCAQGFCEGGVCKKVENDLVARLWGLIDKISVDFLIESFKNNMVGCVVGFSLILYLPLCIGIWCFSVFWWDFLSILVNNLKNLQDRSRKKKWEKENSVMVRKDRTLAHDEDKRPVSATTRSEASHRPPVNTSNYLVPLPRRPGSGPRNQIQPLDHKPNSSRA